MPAASTRGRRGTTPGGVVRAAVRLPRWVGEELPASTWSWLPGRPVVPSMQPPMTPAFPIDEAVIILASHPDDSRIELLLQKIEQHIRGEAGALVQYECLAQVSEPIVSLVMLLILADERRHHALLERIAATLRDALYWTRSADALPSTLPTEGVAPELASLARTLIKDEQDGARALRELAARERGIDGGLDSALLEMMALDSEKHARLLQFVQRRLARASSA